MRRLKDFLSSEINTSETSKSSPLYILTHVYGSPQGKATEVRQLALDHPSFLSAPAMIAALRPLKSDEASYAPIQIRRAGRRGSVP
jgi:hypothetical protein